VGVVASILALWCAFSLVTGVDRYSAQAISTMSQELANASGFPCGRDGDVLYVRRASFRVVAPLDGTFAIGVAVACCAILPLSGGRRIVRGLTYAAVALLLNIVAVSSTCICLAGRTRLPVVLNTVVLFVLFAGVLLVTLKSLIPKPESVDGTTVT
jgi:hypothetical protein